MSESPAHLPECSGSFARILLAEDDVIVRSTCSQALRRAGYSVEAVANGVEAWEALQKQSFDLLVTDNNMPCLIGEKLIFLNGEELILKMRQAGMTLPIIGMTGSAKFFSSETNERLADTLCFRKPFDFRELLSAIKRLLGSAGRRRAKPHPTNPVSVRKGRTNRSNDRC